jgi:hypothetical protein
MYLSSVSWSKPPFPPRERSPTELQVLTTYVVTFHEDTLFCEWAYFIDFEKKTLECYQQKDLIDTVSFYDLKNLGERYMDRLVKITSEEYSDEE